MSLFTPARGLLGGGLIGMFRYLDINNYRGVNYFFDSILQSDASFSSASQIQSFPLLLSIAQA